MKYVIKAKKILNKYISWLMKYLIKNITVGSEPRDVTNQSIVCITIELRAMEHSSLALVLCDHYKSDAGWITTQKQVFKAG